MAQFVRISWRRFAATAISIFAGIALLTGAANAQNIEIIETDWQLQPSGRVEVGAVSARSATRDDQIVLNGDAFTVRAQAALTLEDDNTSIRFEVDRIEVFRTDSDRRDINRDRITLQIDQEISEDIDVQVRGRVYDDLVTVESPDTDEIQGSVRVTYEAERKHRVRLRGSWRDRQYDNGPLEATTGQGPRVDAQYRYRFGRYHYATLDLRAESISSDDPERGYSRQSARFSYTQPITRDLRVRPAIEYLNTRFDGRLNEDGRQRRDQLVVPELEALWWTGPWRIEAEAKYVFSGSNVEIREREGHRLTLSVGYVF